MNRNQQYPVVYLLHGYGLTETSTDNVKDRRIQKTKDLLHEALGFLIREKPYDTIVVHVPSVIPPEACYLGWQESLPF
jgi:hypothetical protein